MEERTNPRRSTVAGAAPRGSVGAARIKLPSSPSALAPIQEESVSSPRQTVTKAQTVSVAAHPKKYPTLRTMKPQEIALLHSNVEVALHRVLDHFLSGIDELEKPVIFEMLSRLSEEVDREQLPALADRIINPKLSRWTRMRGLFNKKIIKEATDAALEETRRIAGDKTQNLVQVIAKMETDLKRAQGRIESEINSMDERRVAYRECFLDFNDAVKQIKEQLEEARDEVAQAEQPADLNDVAQKADVDELKSKFQSLEGRALTLEIMLNRLPAEQVLTRQLQELSLVTLQETTSNASARFFSIKSSLIAFKSALITYRVQQMVKQGAVLDENLLRARSFVMKKVMLTAVNAPGDNRLEQAQQLLSIANDSAECSIIREKSLSDNSQKFAQTRALIVQAKDVMVGAAKQLCLDKNVRPWR